MTRNNYSHIKSFADFEDEKMRLFYQIRLSEKKMTIKKMELQEYLNPMRLISALISELSMPLFGFLKSMVQNFIHKKKKASKKQKKSSTSFLNDMED